MIDHSSRLRKEFFQTTSPNLPPVSPLPSYWSAPKLIVEVPLLIHDTQMVRYDYSCVWTELVSRCRFQCRDRWYNSWYCTEKFGSRL